jgi:hypothetical protein
VFVFIVEVLSFECRDTSLRGRFAGVIRLFACSRYTRESRLAVYN